jgi:RNase P protein component
VAAARPAVVWRGSRGHLAVQARIVAMEASESRPPIGAVRVGVTAGKRQARRAVERSLVKRVLREAARHALAALDAAAGERRVDLVLRLKAPVPAADLMNRARFKRELRAEADALLAQLAVALRQGAGGVAA